MALSKAWLEVVPYFKYLGVILDAQGSFRQQKRYTVQRAPVLIYSFSLFAKRLHGPSLRPLLTVISSKLLPTLTYARVAMHGQDELLIDKIQLKVFRRLFKLPNSASPDQVCLEFVLVWQDLAARAEMAKTWYRISHSADKLNDALWLAVEYDQHSAYSNYLLRSSIIRLRLKSLWEAAPSHKSFSREVNKASKLLLFIKDKAKFIARAHAWMIIKCYAKLEPTAYLSTTYVTKQPANLGQCSIMEEHYFTAMKALFMLKGRSTKHNLHLSGSVEPSKETSQDDVHRHVGEL
ncbi:hypothetical protein NDU88_004875 [Pleurodeles waltl]|uniref:Uncharacterized protein n=1 Tax=Pleurodeles waltl TaxID=8319 RepID=A0AAV7TT75_PLEWA|nr:hypothetical protein NDU88_004875 [Pleurodeles waltl]